MATLIDELGRRGYARLSLSVQKENPAARLYREFGFETVSENDEDYIMVRDLSRPWYEMDIRCWWKLFPVEMCIYNPGYPAIYEKEAASLAELFGDSMRRISHIGSTAVPGLAAKPIVDILMGASNNSCRIQRREIFSADKAPEGVVAGSYGD